MVDFNQLAQDKTTSRDVKVVNDANVSNAHIYPTHTRACVEYGDFNNGDNVDNVNTLAEDTNANTNADYSFADQMEAQMPGYLDWAFGGPLPPGQNGLH